MRLLRCHIDNFGKLRNFTVDFTEPLTVFKAENGWGKSTLATFIKVMFFGFENEKKRGDALERERVRYRPWQGGVYGGELEFEAEGRKYRLNRTFGLKDAEDTFALYDMATNLKCEDFSEQIGEELFRINRESFLRTVFIAQSDCETNTTDSIHAKIGNLADNLDDINLYEEVQEKLKSLQNSLSPTRKTGSLRSLKEAIAQQRDSLRGKSQLEAAAGEIRGKLEECRVAKEELKQEEKRLREERENLAAAGELAAKKQHYASILQKCRDKQEQVDSEVAALGGKVPARDELEKVQNKRTKMVAAQSQREANRLTEKEREELARTKEMFGDEIPAKEELEQALKLATHIEKLREDIASADLSVEEQRELQSLEQSFGTGAVSERRLAELQQNWNIYCEKKSGMGSKRATLSSLRVMEEREEKQREESQKRRKHGAIFGLLLGVGLLLGGGVCGILLWQGGLSLVLLAAGLISLVFAAGLFLTGKRTSAHSENQGVVDLEQEIAADEEQMESLCQSVIGFLKGYDEFAGWEDNENGVRDTLYRLRSEWNQMQRLLARKKDYLALHLEEQLEQSLEALRGCLNSYYPPEILERSLRGEAGIAVATEISGKTATAYSCKDLVHFLRSDREICTRLNVKQENFVQADKEWHALNTQIQVFLTEYTPNRESASVVGNAQNPENAANSERAASAENIVSAAGTENAEIFGQDIDARLQYVAKKLADYENDAEELVQLRKECEEFVRLNDVAALEQEAVKCEHTAEEVRILLEECAERSENLTEKTHSYQNRLEELEEKLEEMDSLREQLEEMERQYKEGLTYFENLGRTSEYLARAKESFSAKYIGPVMKSFEKYYGLLCGENADDFRMDANIQVTRRVEGEQRAPKAFSAGSQDLIYVAMRMALVEAMYRGEKPFLVFDDSFVNLDEEKMECAKHFLQEAAKEYQILYFTCHESRAV